MSPKNRKLVLFFALGCLLLVVGALVALRQSDLKQSTRLYRRFVGGLLVRHGSGGKYETVRLTSNLRVQQLADPDSVRISVLRDGQWLAVTDESEYLQGVANPEGFQKSFSSRGSDGRGFYYGAFFSYWGRAGFLQPEIKRVLGIEFGECILEWEILVLGPRPESIRVSGILQDVDGPLPFKEVVSGDLPAN